MKILFGNINEKFFIFNGNFSISFNKNYQEIFCILNNFNISELWILTGPSSFIATRSILAFSLGYVFNTSITLKGFNILIDLLPLMSIGKNSNKLFFVNELNRFFYCIKEEDLTKRSFFLLSYEEFMNYKNNYFLIGNHPEAHENIILNESILFNIIKDNVNIKNISEIKIEYCGKFII
jgi:hypothetical protein